MAHAPKYVLSGAAGSDIKAYVSLCSPIRLLHGWLLCLRLHPTARDDSSPQNYTAINSANIMVGAHVTRTATPTKTGYVLAVLYTVSRPSYQQSPSCTVYARFIAATLRPRSNREHVRSCLVTEFNTSDRLYCSNRVNAICVFLWFWSWSLPAETTYNGTIIEQSTAPQTS